MNDKTYNWTGTLSAPKEYPVEIYAGKLVSADNSYYFGPIWGLISTGWGEVAGTMSTDDVSSSLPDSLEMTWYAVQENKFYTGKWALDTASITALWEEGCFNPDTQVNEFFESFVVGLAPKGQIAIWIKGTEQTLVGTYQARDTIINKEKANEDFEYFFREDYKQVAYDGDRLYGQELFSKLKQFGWPDPTLFADYNRLYQWQPHVQGIESPTDGYYYYACFNGNIGFIPDNTMISKPIPFHIYYQWQDKEGEKWLAEAKFAFEDIVQAFGGNDKDRPIDFIMDIDISMKKLDILVKSGTKEIKIKTKEKTLVNIKN